MDVFSAHGAAATRKFAAFPAGLAIAALLALSSCGPPPPPPPTIVNAQVTAGADVNATQDGKGAPLAVRVYQLGSKAGFEGAEFFRLYNADTATLGPDLVKKEEFVLTPGGSKSLSLTPTDQVKSIGVFGAYREFQTVVWRATADVAPNKTVNLVITADKAGIKIAAKPAP
jgi:type VI secretion system protein VasD